MGHGPGEDGGRLLHGDQETGNADCADDTDGEAFAGDCDLTGPVSSRVENDGRKFLNP